jgi:anti-sigma B factor antagonist
MIVNTLEENGALIALAEGRIDSSNARDFDDSLKKIIEGSQEAVLIDFQSLTYISSAGLRVILMTAKNLQKLERKFMVCALSAAVRELFEISGFDKVIQVHDTRAEALAAVNG